MKKSFSKLFFTALCLGSLFLAGCGKDDDEIVDDPIVIAPTSQGVFVTNEGQFLQSNGSVSFIDFQSKTVQNDLFHTANARPLGDVVQSMTIAGDKAYLLVNNSNKIEVAEAGTFKSVGVISNLLLPRYFATAYGKGYVTEWVSFAGNGRVSVIDLATNTVSKTIAVGALPDRMLVHNNKLYVVNSAGNTVSVINTQNDAAENPITVGDSPNSLALDAAGNLWVLSGGNKVYDPVTFEIDETASTAGSLAKVNLSSNSVETTLPFASKKALPSNLNANGSKTSFVYNYDGKVYRIESSATALPATALINRSFYGLDVDPNDNSIFGSEVGNFSSNGKVVRFNASGQATDSFTVGIGPNNFFFK